jgi:hypothetical protein
MGVIIYCSPPDCSSALVMERQQPLDDNVAFNQDRFNRQYPINGSADPESPRDQDVDGDGHEKITAFPHFIKQVRHTCTQQTQCGEMEVAFCI